MNYNENCITRKDLVKEMRELLTRAEEITKLILENKQEDMEFMTVKEFCNYIKCSDKKAHSMIKQARATNAFITTKVGTDYRVDKNSFKNWVLKTGGVFEQ